MSGKEFTPPLYATKKLAEIILKACPYIPAERYSTATEMRIDLEREIKKLDSLASEGIVPQRKREAVPEVMQVVNSIDSLNTSFLSEEKKRETVSILSETSHVQGEMMDWEEEAKAQSDQDKGLEQEKKNNSSYGEEQFTERTERIRSEKSEPTPTQEPTPPSTLKPTPTVKPTEKPKKKKALATDAPPTSIAETEEPTSVEEPTSEPKPTEDPLETSDIEEENPSVSEE